MSNLLRIAVAAAIFSASAAAPADETPSAPTADEVTSSDIAPLSKEYLERWTPGGDANASDLPYPQVTDSYQSEGDPDWVDGRWQQTVKGPFLSHSILLPDHLHSILIPDHQVGPKLTAVAAGPGKFLLYDLEAGSFVAAVTDGEIRIDPARYGMLNRPLLAGDVSFYRPATAMWRAGDRQAAVPREAIDYQGLHLSGDRVLMVIRVDGVEVMESPLPDDSDATAAALANEIEVVPHSKPLWLMLATGDKTAIDADGRGASWTDRQGKQRSLAIDAASTGVTLEQDAEAILLHWPSTEQSTAARISYRAGDGANVISAAAEPPQLTALKQPGPRRWGEPLAAPGVVANPADAADAPYVVDRIDPPRENPFHALFYIAGLDFFPHGDAAVCTVHGDVWIVRGLDAGLQHVTWQRFATGLYQPLGLEIVDGKVIVLGRDQLTRLHDENDDGEADFYESFNHDLIDQGAPHAYAMRLERTPDGSFVFMKSGEGPHGSAILHLSADGQRLDVLARGFRHPFGMGAGPNGDVTVGDNEGNWVPSSKIDLIARDGFYGYLGSAEEQGDHPSPARPLCYIPKVADNSCGGQFWHTSDRWGPYHRGGMFHFSWGRCTLHAVLEQQAGDVRQAATVQIPGVILQSGPAEAEFHPRDGQLYVVGLDGWQTAAQTDGSFERIRYTGQPVHLPSSFAAYENAIVLGFDEPLDASSLQGEKSIHVEQWNYQWRPEYGSYHFSVADPKRVGHDVVQVDDASLSPDGKQLRLRIAGLRPVDQIQISLDVRTADGAAIRTSVYGTINALASPIEWIKQ